MQRVDTEFDIRLVWMKILSRNLRAEDCIQSFSIRADCYKHNSRDVWIRSRIYSIHSICLRWSHAIWRPFCCFFCTSPCDLINEESRSNFILFKAFHAFSVLLSAHFRSNLYEFRFFKFYEEYHKFSYSQLFSCNCSCFCFIRYICLSMSVCMDNREYGDVEHKELSGRLNSSLIHFF